MPTYSICDGSDVFCLVSLLIWCVAHSPSVAVLRRIWILARKNLYAQGVSILIVMVNDVQWVLKSRHSLGNL